jgi:hypothetical protein
MAPSAPAPIAALRDIDGVIGCFFVDRDGRIALRDLPGVFDTSLLDEVGPRVVRLGETLEAGGNPPEAVALRFADHHLHLKYMRSGALVALCEPKVNTAALKMALALSARRAEQSPDAWRVEAHDHGRTMAPLSAAPLTQRSVARGAAPVSRTPEPAPPPPKAPAEPESKGRAPVMYRGRRIR